MTSDGHVELLVLAYDDVKKAGEVFKKLEGLQNSKSIQVITAAALVKDVEGKTSAEATLDIAKKKGTRRGALAGGLLAIVAPPVGVAGLLVGAVGGALVGRRLKKKPERNFTKRFLEDIFTEMRGDSSALVVLTEAADAETAATALQEFGGELFRQVLSAEAVDQLAHAADREQPVQNGPDADLADEIAGGVKAAVQVHKSPYQSVFVIVNPASGQDVTILNTLNSVFRAAGIDWDIAITKKSGDAARLARESAENGTADIVAVYGGDGTVMETASGLIDTDMPLAILPGGTNNVMSVELGIPKDLRKAAGLIGSSNSRLRTVDMGTANDQLFILRIGIGYEAEINELADREMKDRFGGFAYTLGGLKALQNPPLARYHLTLDGKEEELDGLWCMIANSASLGIPNVGVAHGVDVGDGLLDVIVIRHRDLDSLLSLAGSITQRDNLGQPLPHWQVREVIVEADPPMAVTGDGEIWEPTPIKAKVIPDAVKILVPGEIRS
ncbi:MAG: YegS/Rv2252/BmrU family lipid kinase [Candidatus Promineifilaceae bacterium]|nr:YegS/Rv2252/BmrU family lipid kinase [Candidatus Promineifilaceae bacterium]